MKKVPAFGPKDADVMVVGEAPGADEERLGVPFVGKAGQLIERYMSRAGYPWPKVYRTNLSKHRPPKNQFVALDPDLLKEGLLELSSEIREVNPNIIVAFGNWPMYYLTNCTGARGKAGTGISNWRGSIVEGSSLHIPSAKGKKVLITYHPAYIIRPGGFGWHTVFLTDLKKIAKEHEFPEVVYPQYESLIDPPGDSDLRKELGQAEWLSVDIETFGNSLACVGFADSKKRGVCVTYQNPNGWDTAIELLASPAKKIFQYGAFDINYLDHFYQWETKNYAFDTYIATANLLPELPRGLDFLTSIYTPFPFYKEERKTWKETGDMTSLWEYNVKDIIATYWIAMEQMKELGELYV